MSTRTKWIIGVCLLGVVLCLFSSIILMQQRMRDYSVLAQELQPTQTPHPFLDIGSEYISEVDGMVMAYIPAGDFLMGTSAGQRDEKPEHTVYLDSFWIDKTEVTNQKYSGCVQAGACRPPAQTHSATRHKYYGNPEFADFPVIYVSWNQARDYCEWAGRQLPSESQWEKAGRGTDGQTYPWGEESPIAAWLNFNGYLGDTTQVGSFPQGSSPYGILDLAGNVLEWAGDCYGSSYYGRSPRQNPGGPSACEHNHRVIRGGTSWVGSSPEWSGAADRLNNRAGYTSSGVGFRCSLQTGSLDLEKLFRDVFNPYAGEAVLVIVDLPGDEFLDNDAWADRRMMAEEWRAAIEDLEPVLGISVHPLYTYAATGAHNGPLPEEGELGGETVLLEEVLTQTDIVLAFTEYSATAPFTKLTEKFPDLRVASMPMISRNMEQTALAADYSDLHRKAVIFKDMLDLSVGARLLFSTGHELFIDLRFRNAELDGGQVHLDQVNPRVINLPSGETYIAPYEGEVQGLPSLTAGVVPLPCGNEYSLLVVQENRIVDVQGENDCVNELHAFFDLDQARRNIAELGLGVNNHAVVSGNVLEDEKVWGVHLAVGRSDHLGGVVGVESFSNPNYVVHRDVVYPFSGSIYVESMDLELKNGKIERIIENGSYIVFEY